MKPIGATIAGASMLALTACQGVTSDQLIGGAVGAGAGYVAADLLEADDDWTLLATLGGAAAGTLVAQNRAARACAYANGDGTYYRAPCP